MRPQWRCPGSRIEYKIARPRVDSGRGGPECVVPGGTRQTLGRHCESLPVELRVRPDAGSPFVRKANDLALATSHLPQSSSASRVTAAQSGFFILSQSGSDRSGSRSPYASIPMPAEREDSFAPLRRPRSGERAAHLTPRLQGRGDRLTRTREPRCGLRRACRFSWDHPTVLAATNKCLAQGNKSSAGREATNKRDTRPALIPLEMCPMKPTIKIRFTEPQIALVMRANPNCNLDRLTELWARPITVSSRPAGP